jgi:uncharacterized protein (TIGR00251 family)
LKDKDDLRAAAPDVVRVLQIRVKPRSRNSVLERMSDGTWVAKLKSPPVDGKANAELIALVAEHFKCGKAAVSIKSGASGRMKLVKVETAGAG